MTNDPAAIAAKLSRGCERAVLTLPPGPVAYAALEAHVRAKMFREDLLYCCTVSPPTMAFTELGLALRDHLLKDKSHDH